MKSKLAIITAALVLSSAAQANVSISSNPTENMNCSAGVCTATANKAVLNVDELQNMLAGGDVTVKTGKVAKDIHIDQPITWSTTSRLTLDSQHSVMVRKPVSVAGIGALTITTNDHGGNGEFATVLGQGSVHFSNLASGLTIDGNSYTLVGDVKTLDADIAGNPSGFYALAGNFDASADGSYIEPPVATPFTGTFEGLGNAIQNLVIATKAVQSGFFSAVGGTVRDLRLENESLRGGRQEVGGLAANNSGSIRHVEVTGAVEGVPRAGLGCVGGLVGYNGGAIVNSDSRASVSTAYGASGGLVCQNSGQIVESFATGNVSGEEAGGLVGEYNGGSVQRSFATGAVGGTYVGGLISHIVIYYEEISIEDCYATGSVTSGSGETGGLIGFAQGGDGKHILVARGFATGAISAPAHTEVGGVIGRDLVKKYSALYWDLDTTGVSNPHRGAGNKRDDPNLTGLTDAQLKAGLPEGFDALIWGQSPDINNGYPYLLPNPPPK
jgi:hypothetical protein